MLLPEPDAKKTVCPHLPTDVFVEAVNNGMAHRVERFSLCIASDCMMWRKHDQIGIGPNGEKRERDMDGRTRWVDRGYCGLAGKP